MILLFDIKWCIVYDIWGIGISYIGFKCDIFIYMIVRINC